MSLGDDTLALLQAAGAGAAKGAAVGSIIPGVGTAVGGAAGALLGVAMDVIPGAADLIAPGTAAANKAVQAVQAVTGAATPAAAQAALADVDTLSDLRIQLAQIAADARRDADAAQTDQLKATLGDVAGARQQTLALAQAGSPLAWGAAAVSLVVALGFFAALGILVFGPVPEDKGVQAMLNAMVGVLGAGLTSTLGYWLGSSAGSAHKTALLAQSVPATLLPSPAAIEPAR